MRTGPVISRAPTICNLGVPLRPVRRGGVSGPSPSVTDVWRSGDRQTPGGRGAKGWLVGSADADQHRLHRGAPLLMSLELASFGWCFFGTMGTYDRTHHARAICFRVAAELVAREPPRLLILNLFCATDIMSGLSDIPGPRASKPRGCWRCRRPRRSE